ncbi:hypothetical protein [Mucilaginibacter sp.]|uniref:hypothetical protein n=1 Tax=Mucilaginibacter sp. TaxID=1882438 RepID=UPI000CC1E60F|nr:hypothetical protein [Mucilaginibacter sp.]PLW89682.1 MAG: hypothetical protein C0154_10415 [Mucilaginibacter sp.]PMP65178.1 MAG: hypothetical protein C0191_04385 [Mucilaginibacter sp.]HEK21142.1 hypothetical protein [Bacteroidota bacterium]
MIAVVTSTLKPGNNNTKGFYNFDERLSQTIQTLNSLYQHGFEHVYLIDNSPSLTEAGLQAIFTDFKSLKVYHTHQYQFDNKGINELLMLLLVSEHLPKNQPIFKISGRYCLTEQFMVPEFTAFAVKGYDYHSRNGAVSTRGYWVKDADKLQCFLKDCLTEVFAYPERIVGVRSLIKKTIQFVFKRPYIPVNVSIEFAAANVLKRGKLNVTLLSQLGIRGLVAGNNQREEIIE